MKSEIEQKLIKNSKAFIFIGMFFYLSLLYFVTNKYLAWTIFFLTWCIAFIGICLNLHINQFYMFKTFWDQPYYIKFYYLTNVGKGLIYKTIIEILKSNKEPIIKKYDYILMRIWIDYYNIHFAELCGSIKLTIVVKKIRQAHALIDSLAMDLFQKNEGKDDFTKLCFNPNSKLNEKELRIAQNSYFSYSHLGMAGKFLIEGNDFFKFLLQLQNYQFTHSDLIYLNKHIKKLEKRSKNKQYIRYDIEEIVNNNDYINSVTDSESLYILLKFFRVFLYYPIVYQEQLLNIIKRIQIQIDYIHFQNDICKKTEEITSMKKSIKI